MNLNDFEIDLIAEPFCVLRRKSDQTKIPCRYERRGCVTYFTPLDNKTAPFNDSYIVKKWLNRRAEREDIYLRPVNGGFFADKAAKVLHSPLEGVLMGQIYVDHHNLLTGECVGSIPVQCMLDPSQFEIIENGHGC